MVSSHTGSGSVSHSQLICPFDGGEVRPDTKPGRASCKSCQSVWYPYQEFTESLQALLRPREAIAEKLACLDCGNNLVELQVEKLDAFIWSCPPCQRYLARPRERAILEKRQTQLLVGEHYASLSDKGKRSFFRQLNDTQEAEKPLPEGITRYHGTLYNAEPKDIIGIFRLMPTVRAEHIKYRHFLAPLLTTLCLLTMTFFGHTVSAPAILADAGVLSWTRLHAFLLHSGFASLVMTHILFDGIEDRLPRWLLLMVLCTLFGGFGLLSDIAAEPAIILGGPIVALYSGFSSLLAFPKAPIYVPYSGSKLSIPSWMLALTLIVVQALQLSSQALIYQLCGIGFAALLAIVSFGLIRGLGYDLQSSLKDRQAN